MVPPVLEAAQQATLKGAVQELPANSGVELANWNWKVVCQYVSGRFGISLSRNTCLTPYQVRGDVTGCTGWDSPLSVPRSVWSRRTRPSGNPS